MSAVGIPQESPRILIERRLVAAMKQHLGPTVCDLTDDPNVIEIMLNDDGQLWEDRLGEGMRPIGTMSAVAAESFISLVASSLGTTVTRDNPLLEAELPIRGARFEAAIEPVTSAPIFAIRLKAVKVFPLADYVTAGIMTTQQKAICEDAVATRQNIVVSGGTGAGKSTLVNALLSSVSEQTPDDRVVILEDMRELQCKARNSVALRTTDTVDLRALVRATMRFRPDRIIIGEVRGGEALDMAKAWNTGHDGGLSTVHANSARSALHRIENLIAEVAKGDMRRTISEAINIIVPIVKTKTSRKVNPIVRVEGLHNGEYVLTQLEG